jgi:cell division protein FtsB
MPGGAVDSAPVPRALSVRISYALGITSPRRAAMLAVMIFAMTLSVAVPLRNYLSQRSELAAVHERQEILADQVAELERRRALLEDPGHIEAQARERLRYVRPGETPYVVQLPPAAPQPRTGEDKVDDPWFAKLWESIVGG